MTECNTPETNRLIFAQAPKYLFAECLSELFDGRLHSIGNLPGGEMVFPAAGIAFPKGPIVNRLLRDSVATDADALIIRVACDTDHCLETSFFDADGHKREMRANACIDFWVRASIKRFGEKNANDLANLTIYLLKTILSDKYLMSSLAHKGITNIHITQESSYEDDEDALRVLRCRFSFMLPDSVTCTYITTYTRLQKALQRNNHCTLTNIFDAFIIIAPDGIIKYTSPNIEKWVGWRPAELSGSLFWQHVHLDDVEAAKDCYRMLLIYPNTIRDARYRYQCKNGLIRSIDYTIVNLTHDPDVCGVLMYYRGVACRRLSEDANFLFDSIRHQCSNDSIKSGSMPDGMCIEDALRKKSRRKAMRVDIPDIIAIIDDCGIIRYASSNIENWLGWRCEEVVGIPILQYLHPEDVYITKIYVSDLFQIPQVSRDFRQRFRCRNNSYMSLWCTAANHLQDSDVLGILLNYHLSVENYLSLIPLPAPPHGFEEAHDEWLKQGGKKFYIPYHHDGRDIKGYYRTQYWKLVKKAALARDHFNCCRCGNVAVVVHHNHYETLGAEHFWPNILFSVCHECHRMLEYSRLAIHHAWLIDRRLSGDEINPQTVLRYAGKYTDFQKELFELKNKYNKHIDPIADEKQRLAEYKQSIKIHPVLGDNQLNAKIDQYEIMLRDKGRDLMSDWIGDDKDKTIRLITLFEALKDECLAFADEVLAHRQPVRNQQLGLFDV